MASPFQQWICTLKSGWVCRVFNAQLRHRKHTWIQSLLGTKSPCSVSRWAGGEAAEHKLWLPWRKLPLRTAQSWMALVVPLALGFIHIHYYVSSTLSLSFFPEEGASNRDTHRNLLEKASLQVTPPVYGNKVNSWHQPSLWKELSKRKVYFNQVLRDCLGQINALRYPMTIPIHLLSVVAHPCSWRSQ